MAVKYGEGFRRRFKGTSYSKDAIESRFQAILVAINEAEAKGAKSFRVGFQDVLPAHIETLSKFGVTVRLHRMGDAESADPHSVGNMGWHWDKVYAGSIDPWFVLEWRLSWDKLVDVDAGGTSE